MIINNAIVYGADFCAAEADIEIENGKIKRVGKIEESGEDFSGCVILPGFIDIHIHGCNMADATDGKPGSAAAMSRWLVTKGVTSFCPTTMTLPPQTLKECFSFIKTTMGNEEGAYIHGINM
ncbi:MAG: N-acetylglucosamine-6-phosphate deacetylase, partial [Acutalibacteraceae bacterium]